MAEITDYEPTLEDEAPVLAARACESCGAPVESTTKFCAACGAQQAAAARSHEPPPVQKHFRCKNCGAEVAVDPDQRSYVCAFCDSTYVVEFTPQATDRRPPEFVIGFAVTREKAAEKFRGWLRENGWFRPGDLKSAQIEEKLKGVYLPFWSFSMLATSRWSATIGEYWYRTETYTTTGKDGKPATRTRQVRETEWWPLGGNFHHYYSQFLVSGSRGLSQQDAQRIKPFHLAALTRYEPYFLAGWLSEEYSIERLEARAASEEEFRCRQQQNIAATLPGDTHRDLRDDTQFSDVNSDLILLPVYLLSYRYGDKLYRFMVNGQTGKLAGDKPLSWRRIALAAGVVLGAAALLIMLFAIMQS